MDLFTLQRLQLSAQGKAQGRALDRVRLVVDRISLARADRIVVLGECMRDVAQTLYGGDRVDVVPIWQPASEFSGGDAAGMRAEWEIAPTATVVLYSGHLNYRHSVDSVPLAARRLEAEDIEFVFIGDGDKFEALAAAEGRPANLQFRRKSPQRPIRDVLAAGDIHLVALDEDATGTCVPSKVYAAMAASKPVIYLGSAEGQGARDVLEAQAGFVVATDDVDALTRCIQRLHDNSAARATLGSDGHAFFAASRDLPVVAAQWRDLLHKVTPTRPPVRRESTWAAVGRTAARGSKSAAAPGHDQPMPVPGRTRRRSVPRPRTRR
jgi:glycosyltransferase involved in cell wall biosynthesis